MNANEMDMKCETQYHLVLVGCGKQKQARPAPAGELYTGQLFRAAKRYAEQHGDAWAILSAKHGLVLPGQVLEPYDLAMDQLQAASDRNAWAGRVQAGLACFLMERPHLMEKRGGFRRLVPGFRMTILAGRRYVEPIAARRIGQNISTPLDGLGIGQRLAWLKQQEGGAA